MRLIVSFALFTLGGCVLMDYSTKDRVTMAAREFNDGVRWGKYDQAAIHIPKEQRERFLERHRRLDDELEIADYEMVSLEIDKTDRKKPKVTARVDYTWTLKNVGLVERTTTQQQWEERDGSWMVVREERVKGSPLTLFEEPQKPASPVQETSATP